MAAPVTITPDGAPAQGAVTITPDKAPSAYETATRSGPYAPAGAAEKAMGEGRSPGQILSDSAKAPAMGAATIAPLLTGGASLPVQAAVGAASGAAQSKLQGGSNKEAGTSAAIGGALPFAGPIAGRLAKTIGKVAGGVVDDIPGVRQLGKLAKYWRETAPEPTYPGAPLPEAPPVNPGAHLPETPAPEQLNPSLVSPSRTTPGQLAAEMTRPQPRASAAPIPARSGLALPPAPRGAELAEVPTPTAKPAAQSGEALARVKSGSLAEAMKGPGAPLPEKPAPQLLQGNALLKGPQPMVDPAAGLGNIKQPGQAGQLAAAMQKPAPAEVAPGFQRGHLQKLLNESVGAKQLDPKVSLRQQMPATKTVPTEAPADLPQGHTAHESSAVPSSMYDSGANEFHARMVSGNTTYVYGDVSPEEAQAFAGAASKGKAFQQIKNGHPLVAKIVDGKRISVKAANPAP